MSLKQCTLSIPGKDSLWFFIENGYDPFDPQAVQLSGVGPMKSNINVSTSVTGSRFIYGAFTEQREISFALKFTSPGQYRFTRDWFENVALGYTQENASRLNDVEKPTLSFTSSSGIDYTIPGFITEVKVDLFTDQPILWASFLCFRNDFYYEEHSEDRNPRGYISLSENEITSVPGVNGTFKGKDLFQKFYKFKDDWNPYGNQNVKAGSFRVVISDSNIKIFRNIKRVILDYFYDYETGENKNFWFEIDNMGDYLHPETTHLDLRFNTPSNGYKDVLIKCWVGSGFTNSPRSTWVPLSMTDTSSSGAEMENWSLRPNNKGESGVWYGTSYVSALPDNVRVWHFFDNPNYYDRSGYVKSVHDV